MKMIKEPNREEMKAVEKLIEAQPELLAMLDRDKARTSARKIVRPLVFVGMALLVIGFILYIYPMLDRIIILLNSAPPVQ